MLIFQTILLSYDVANARLFFINNETVRMKITQNMIRELPYSLNILLPIAFMIDEK